MTKNRCLPVPFLLAICLIAAPSQGRAEVLMGVTDSTGTFPAIAVIEVDTPSTFNFQTNEFVFDGVADTFFTVTGNITLRNGNAVDSFIDPITSNMIGSNGDGLNTVQVEVVGLEDTTLVSGSGVGDITIGDGTGDFAATAGPNQDFFSTGGASENAPSGATADGFLNLFMEIDVQEPLIPQINLPPGELRNQEVLPLEATFDSFLPFGVPFNLVGGPISFFPSPGNPLLSNPLVNSDTELARFTSVQLTIVPEPASVVAGVLALAGFLALAWRTRRSLTSA